MKFFLKFYRRPFSSTKEAFKKIVEYSEIDNMFYKKEKTLFETLCGCIEKQNINRYNEIFDVYEKHKIKLSSDEINQVLSFIINQKSNFDFLERVNHYTSDNDIQLDSISYSFIINSLLKYKGFYPAYNFFFKAKLENVKIDLSTYYNLFHNLDKLKNYQLEASRDFIIHSLKKDFDRDTVKMIEKFVSNLQEKSSKRNKNKDQGKQDSETIHMKLEEYQKVPGNIIILSNENKNKTPLYSEIKIENNPNKDNSSKEKLKNYKDFHKISKKLKLREEYNLDLDLINRRELFNQLEQLVKELNLNKYAQVDLKQCNTEEVQKYKKLEELYERLNNNKELNSPQLISNNQEFSCQIILEFMEQIRKKYLNKIDNGNNFGDD